MKEKGSNSRFSRISWIILKVIFTLVCLYFFICALSFLATASRLLSGKQSGKIFTSSALLHNPIVGVMLGVLATVLVQSSSTTTSIVIGMVGADVLEVPQAIPMVMGANIGTSITNTLVSVGQINDRGSFGRAFACAVVHDMFNWITVAVLLVIEQLTGYLESVTAAMVSGLDSTGSGVSKGSKPPDMLKAITKPFTKLIVQIDKKVLQGWSLNDTKYENVTTLLKGNCKRPVALEPSTPLGSTHHSDGYDHYQCGYLFANWGVEDVWIGLILLVVSLAALLLCLYGLMRVLNSLMEDQMSDIIKRTLNASIPKAPWLTGYLAIAMGTAVTFVIQSSSVFTSTLTPLAGAGLLELTRAYPLTLGANLGTTATGLLAALAADGDKLRDSLQIALCHTMFNFTGIALFYPIPFMRWPIPMAKWLGDTVAQYRWFAFIYLVTSFLIVPGYTFALSLAGPIAIYVGLMPLLAFFFLSVSISALQNKYPKVLPKTLRTWDFLPEFMRSLAPYDRLISTISCLKRGKASRKFGDP